LAVAVALSHTLGVFVLGGVTVAASSAFAPERVYPYLQALSATIVVALGVYLVLRSISSRRARTQSNDHHHHDHHGHDHDHPIHSHGFLPHRHSPRLQALDPSDGPLGWRALALLGLSGGLVPSTSAVVLLLGAVQLERLMLGGVLVLAFGAGMSMALVSVGIGIVMLSRRASGFFDARVFADRMTRLVQPAAGFAVLGVGLYLASRAIASMGSVS
jgi:ABC-type nickel/cobalt efflux system permease component RcnA